MYDPQETNDVLQRRIAYLRDTLQVIDRMVTAASTDDSITARIAEALRIDDLAAAEHAQPIVLKESLLDFRDVLDGKQISNGDQLQLWLDHDQRWIAVRYEVASARTRAVMLHGEERAYPLDRETMRFRWQ